jgi:Tol biopolymer transport system component
VRKPAVAVVVGSVLLAASAPAVGRERPTRHYVDDYGPVFAPHGKTIVFERVFSTARLGIDPHPVPQRSVLLEMRADGSQKRVFRHAGARFESDPSFSRDGRTILFVRDKRIYRMRRDGRAARPVRRDFLEQACPRFSPDGRRISFWRGRIAKTGGYFVMNADGSGLRRLLATGDEPPWGCPSWFPDGRRLVVAKDYNLYVVSADGSRRKRITRNRQDTLYRPAVSPDGRLIACDGYLAGRFGHGVIVMRVDGAAARRITTAASETENDSAPSWSPDGSRVLFSGYRGAYAVAGVYVVRRDGSGLRRLSNFRR